MPLILPGNVGSATAATGFNVANSCRFDDGSTAYMHKTPGGAGNRRTLTFSTWFKRSSSLGANQVLFSTSEGASTINGDCIRVNDANKLDIFYYDGSAMDYRYTSNQVLRDVSAWYHVCVAIDTTQGTASNRIKVYLNGNEVTSFATETDPSQNFDTQFNNTQVHSVSRRGTSGSEYFDGYMAETVLIDGSQLDPTSFGEFDEDSGIWKPISVSGLTFGTNGFYLDFKDSANLGNDASGGTDLTENNLTAIDQTTDTPTNNFATMNPLAITNSGNTFSEGNLKITTISGASSYNQATIGVSTGKWYWEVKYVSDSDGSGNYARIGIADIDPPGTGGLGEVEGIAYEAINGRKKIRGTQTTYGDTYAPGDIISVALNLDDNELTFYKNGTAQNSGTAIDISSYTPKTGFWHPAFNYDDGSNSGVFEANFGNPTFTGTDKTDGNSRGSFEYAPPSGFLSLCTANLSEVLG